MTTGILRYEPRHRCPAPRPRALLTPSHAVCYLSSAPMPPRRSARPVELANPHVQLPFPPNVVALLFSLLPLDTRLRAREVCRGWRGFLEDASFWTRVDLSASCCVNPRFLTSEDRALALLRAACARAKDNVLSVDLTGVDTDGHPDLDPFVIEWWETASAAIKASLRDLVAPPDRALEVERVTELCRALPLCRVRCGVQSGAVELLPLLRREPPYELLTNNALRATRTIDFGGEDDEDDEADAEDGDQAFLDLASALSVCMGMEKLHFFDVPLTTRAVLDALVDAAISASIKDMDFEECGLSQTALPALTRLMQSPGFERLSVWNDDATLFEGPALPAFCAAVRNCKSLKTLELESVRLWDDMAAASQLIAALEGLPALHKLGLWNNRTDGTPAMQRAVGECLARLIACSTSLRVLKLCGTELGETGLAPIFEALRNNNSLTELCFDDEMFAKERVSLDFARDVVLPAVRANTSLRKLEGLLSTRARSPSRWCPPHRRTVDAEAGGGSIAA